MKEWPDEWLLFTAEELQPASFCLCFKHTPSALKKCLCTYLLSVSFLGLFSPHYEPCFPMSLHAGNFFYFYYWMPDIVNSTLLGAEYFAFFELFLSFALRLREIAGSLLERRDSSEACSSLGSQSPHRGPVWPRLYFVFNGPLVRRFLHLGCWGHKLFPALCSASSFLGLRPQSWVIFSHVCIG